MYIQIVAACLLQLACQISDVKPLGKSAWQYVLPTSKTFIRGF
jgi:hypothetical protein